MSTNLKIAAGTAGAVTVALLSFMGNFEGDKYIPYQDPAVPGLWTVCRGVTNRLADGWVVPGKKYTEEECRAKETELIQTKISPVIDKCRTVAITQRQWEMLVDFAWNEGSNALCKSTLIRKINAGDCLGAAQEFKRWNKASGKVWRGLIRRRSAEEKEFLAWCER